MATKTYVRDWPRPYIGRYLFTYLKRPGTVALIGKRLSMFKDNEVYKMLLKNQSLNAVLVTHSAHSPCACV